MIVFFFYDCICVLSVVLFANSDEFIKNLHLSSSSSPRIYVAAARVTGSYSSFHFVLYAMLTVLPDRARQLLWNYPRVGSTIFILSISLSLGKSKMVYRWSGWLSIIRLSVCLPHNKWTMVFIAVNNRFAIINQMYDERGNCNVHSPTPFTELKFTQGIIINIMSS